MATSASIGSKSSEERFDYNCSACSRKGRVREAVKYCLSCQKYLCTSCLNHHVEIMEDHTLVDPTDRKTVAMPTDNCDRHVTERVKMWCKGHNEALCTVCAFMDHRSCTDVIDLYTDISKVFSEEDIPKVERALKKAKQQIALLKNDEVKRKEGAFLEKNEFIGMVKDYQKKLISIVENLGKASIEEINKWYTDFQGKLEGNMSMLEYLDKDIVNCLEVLELNSDNKAKLFVAMKKGQKLTDKTDSLTSSTPNQGSKFQVKSGIESFLSSFLSLGSFQRSTPRLYKVNEKGEIKVRTTSDAKTCDIESTCLLSDGSILMTDYGNGKLKRLNSYTLTVTDHCDVPETPRAVCLVGQQEVAVSLNGEMIKFVDVGKTMVRTRCFAVGHPCQGLAYSDRELYVHDGQGKVHVYNLSGTLLRAINVGSKSLNVCTEHMAIDGDRLYIACGNNGLLCTDIQGRELYRYKDTKLSHCTGVSIDGCGGVFLSGYDTHNVVQLGTDGKELGEVLTKADGLHNPQSVCFDSSKQQLIVTNQDCDNILVFDLV